MCTAAAFVGTAAGRAPGLRSRAMTPEGWKEFRQAEQEERRQAWLEAYGKHHATGEPVGDYQTVRFKFVYLAL